MTISRYAVAGVFAAAALVAASGCSDHGHARAQVPPDVPSSASSSAPASPSTSSPARSSAPGATSSTGDRPVSSPSPSSGGSGATPSPSADASQLRNTTVYGEIHDVTVSGGVVRLTWDRGDWAFAPNPPGTREHLKSCQRWDHGDVLTNCNADLRTTAVPDGIPIGVVQPSCSGSGGGDISDVPDPLHPRHAMGGHQISAAEFARRAQNGCAGQPHHGFDGGLWLTFDGSGTLTRINEKFVS